MINCCAVLLYVFTFWVPCCDVRYNCSARLYLQLFVRVLMSYLHYICLRIVVSNTYYVVFLLCVSSSCVPYIASFSGLNFWLALRYSLTFI
jgi:hypothetical protein